MKALIWPIINVATLVGILVYTTRAPLREFLKTRRKSIGEELIRVRELMESAKTKYEEFTAKLKAIDAEVLSLNEQVRSDAERMRSRILADAKQNAGSIVSDARTSANALYGDLKNELRVELGMRVLARAEKLLVERLTGDDRVRIRREFSTQVERIQ